MRRHQPLQRLPRHRRKIPQRQGTTPQRLFQRFAIEKLHHDDRFPVQIIQIVDRDNIRVLQRGQSPRLLAQIRPYPLPFALFRGQQALDGHVAFEPPIPCLEDRPGPSLPQAFENIVS